MTNDSEIPHRALPRLAAEGGPARSTSVAAPAAARSDVRPRARPQDRSDGGAGTSRAGDDAAAWRPDTRCPDVTKERSVMPLPHPPHQPGARGSTTSRGVVLTLAVLVVVVLLAQ